jgi:IS605 OrfB family transposase
MEQETLVHTFQTRPNIGEITEQVMQAMADLFSRVLRTLFTDIMKGEKITQLKSKYLKEFQITARQFNAARVTIEGMIRSRKELQIKQIAELKLKIKALEKKVAKLKNPTRLYWKRQKLKKLEQKLLAIVSDQKNGIVRICFGTRKKFHAQYHLEESGYHSFEDWKKDWQQSRNNSFFFLGSKDETAGNQTCSAFIQPDGKLTLRIRLPDALSQYGKYLTIPNLFFAYGHDIIVASLNDCLERSALQKAKNPAFKEHGQALSYRLLKDKKGWRIFISTALAKPQWQTNARLGCIGLDINADHLAIAETDHFGNPINNYSIPLNLYGKDQNQAKAIIGDAAKKVIALALAKKKDLVIEKLDFQEKKTTLKNCANAKYARMLSSFAYAAIILTLKSRGWRSGVQIHQVNPAFTSIIGRIKYSKRYGYTIHQAAALCIGRRFLGFSEKAPDQALVPDGKGFHVAFPVPVRKRGMNEWLCWGVINRKFRVVLAAHFRTAKADPLTRQKPVSETKYCPEIVGEIPIHESLATLLG